MSSLGVDALTSVYNSPTAGLSTEQRTQTIPSGKVIIKTIRVDASGTSTSETQTRTPANPLNGLTIVGGL